MSAKKKNTWCSKQLTIIFYRSLRRHSSKIMLPTCHPLKEAGPWSRSAPEFFYLKITIPCPHQLRDFLYALAIHFHIVVHFVAAQNNMTYPHKQRNQIKTSKQQCFQRM